MESRTLERLGPIDAAVRVPGSKSIANRALIAAALANGGSTIRNAPTGDDTSVMIACLTDLGSVIASEVPSPDLDDSVDLTVDGGGAERSVRRSHLDAALAGTTSRFVTALASLWSTPITIDGAPPLRGRPFGPLHAALAQLGVTVDPVGGVGHLPVTVTGPPTAGTVQMRGDVSSQFVTALMLIGPYLPGGLQLELTSPLVSRPYVDLTVAVMEAFGHVGIGIGGTDANPTVLVPGGTYQPCVLDVEPDASSASYPLAMAAVAGGRVTIAGLGTSSAQGDATFARLLAEMGCDVEQTTTTTSVSRPPGRSLVGIDVDMADVSDLVPTLAAVALFADTPTRIRGVGFIRGKESDRLGDLSSEFAKLGATIDVTDDGLAITPTTLHGGAIDPHHDHRLAMAAGVVAAAVDGVTVLDPDVVTKSWPGYWTMREHLR